MFRVRLAKENFKFSCSHFTIFAADHAENLHGHNYYVTAEFSLTGLDPELGLAFDFNVAKPVLRNLVDALDEKVLIPQNSKFLKTSRAGDQFEVSFGSKKYSFPNADVAVLPVVNITSEELARYVAESFVKAARSSQHEGLKKIRSVSIGIEETRGQTVFYDLEL